MSDSAESNNYSIQSWFSGEKGRGKPITFLFSEASNLDLQNFQVIITTDREKILNQKSLEQIDFPMAHVISTS